MTSCTCWLLAVERDYICTLHWYAAGLWRSSRVGRIATESEFLTALTFMRT